MTVETEVAIVGSGFAGSLLARILATVGYDVTLIERGRHPRFAIGESSTPMANLTLERIAARYGFDDCRNLATHGRWMRAHPGLMRGLKRGFTFYRHHPGLALDARERLLVAASPDDEISDTHWLRADVDHHFVRAAGAAGVDYREGVELTGATIDHSGVRLSGTQAGGAPLEIRARFLVDASGPGGFAARQLAIPPALDRTATRSSLVFSHFAGVRRMSEIVPALPPGPYTDDWAAMHHIVDEGWMYSLRFDDGVTSAGFLLSAAKGSAAAAAAARDPDAAWRAIIGKYPTVAAAFADAQPLFPIRFVPAIQHRLAAAAGERWAMLPHAYAFVDPLFSTGIAWGLRGVERLARLFEDAKHTTRTPAPAGLERYDRLLAGEGDMIDRLVAGAYHAMDDFETFAAHSMIYFALVSFGEVRQRLSPNEDWAWAPFLDAGDALAESVVAESAARLGAMARLDAQSDRERALAEYVAWVAQAIAPRNIAGLADATRRHLYPVDLDVLVDGHARLGLTREALVEKLPLLRGA